MKTLMCSNKIEDIDDVTRIIILKLMVNVFFTTKTSNVVPWHYISYVQDLNRINQFNWANEIVENLLKSLVKREPTSVNGCRILLIVSSILYSYLMSVLHHQKSNFVCFMQYWLCTHTTTFTASKLEELDSEYPRFRKWNLEKFNETMASIMMDDVNPDQVTNFFIVFVIWYL